MALNQPPSYQEALERQKLANSLDDFCVLADSPSTDSQPAYSNTNPKLQDSSVNSEQARLDEHKRAILGAIHERRMKELKDQAKETEMMTMDGLKLKEEGLSVGEMKLVWDKLQFERYMISERRRIEDERRSIEDKRREEEDERRRQEDDEHVNDEALLAKLEAEYQSNAEIYQDRLNLFTEQQNGVNRRRALEGKIAEVENTFLKNGVFDMAYFVLVRQTVTEYPTASIADLMMVITAKVLKQPIPVIVAPPETKPAPVFPQVPALTHPQPSPSLAKRPKMAKPPIEDDENPSEEERKADLAQTPSTPIVNENRPVCKYDPQCYRKNPQVCSTPHLFLTLQHLIEFRHPSKEGRPEPVQPLEMKKAEVISTAPENKPSQPPQIVPSQPTINMVIPNNVEQSETKPTRIQVKEKQIPSTISPGVDMSAVDMLDDFDEEDFEVVLQSKAKQMDAPIQPKHNQSMSVSQPPPTSAPDVEDLNDSTDDFVVVDGPGGIPRRKVAVAKQTHSSTTSEWIVVEELGLPEMAPRSKPNLQSHHSQQNISKFFTHQEFGCHNDHTDTFKMRRNTVNQKENDLVGSYIGKVTSNLAQLASKSENEFDFSFLNPFNNLVLTNKDTWQSCKGCGTFFDKLNVKYSCLICRGSLCSKCNVASFTFPPSALGIHTGNTESITTNACSECRKYIGNFVGQQVFQRLLASDRATWYKKHHGHIQKVKLLMKQVADDMEAELNEYGNQTKTMKLLVGQMSKLIEQLTASIAFITNEIKNQRANRPAKLMNGEPFPDNTEIRSLTMLKASMAAYNTRHKQILARHQPVAPSTTAPSTPVAPIKVNMTQSADKKDVLHIAPLSFSTPTKSDKK